MYSEDNLLYVLTMLEAVEKIQLYTAPFKSADAFFEADNQMHFHAVSHLLLAIGEESKKIESGLKELYGNIPWKSLAGLRDRLAHNYRGTDYDLVYAVVREDLPVLKTALVSMLQHIDYDPAALDAALSSSYYRHLGYLK